MPLLNLPVWLALNGYLVGREYAELVASRRLAPAMAARLRRDHRLVFWLAGAVIAFLLAVPILNLVAPVVGAAFMTMRFQRYCGEATNALREVAVDAISPHRCFWFALTRVRAEPNRAASVDLRPA